jgi:hypothetical protein
MAYILMGIFALLAIVILDDYLEKLVAIVSLIFGFLLVSALTK